MNEHSIVKVYLLFIVNKKANIQLKVITTVTMKGVLQKLTDKFVKLCIYPNLTIDNKLLQLKVPVTRTHPAPAHKALNLKIYRIVRTKPF